MFWHFATRKACLAGAGIQDMLGSVGRPPPGAGRHRTKVRLLQAPLRVLLDAEALYCGITRRRPGTPPLPEQPDAGRVRDLRPLSAHPTPRVASRGGG